MRRTRARRSVALVALTVLAVAPAAARAHGEASPLVRSVIEGLEPQVDGVRLVPVRGPAAQAVVRNQTRTPLEVLDDGGRPFLRLSPRGTEADVASPAWYESGNPDGQGRPDVRPGRPARWRLVSRRAEWAYYEHRLHPSAVRIPPDVLAARRTARLAGFTVPLRHGGRALAVRGRLEFRPVLGTVTPTLRSAPTPLPGVRIAVLPGVVPGVLLQNASPTPVTVLGAHGEPFARIGPRGAFVNTRSPVHLGDLRTRGGLPTVAADPDAPPRWARASPGPSLTWLDTRAAYRLEQPPDAVVTGERPARLVAWSLGLRAGPRTAEVRGTTDWVPTDAAGRPAAPAAAAAAGSGGTGGLALAGGAAVVAVLCAGGLALRRRCVPRGTVR